MRGQQACSSLVAITTSSFRQEVALLFKSRDFATKGSSVASSSSRGGDGGRKGRTQELIEALTPTEKISATEKELEEAALRAKEYSRQKMREHRKWQAEFMTKVKLRDAAIAALPESIRNAAMAPDLELFPSTRQVWSETPPHEHSDQQQLQRDDSDKRKGKIGTKM